MAPVQDRADGAGIAVDRLLAEDLFRGSLAGGATGVHRLVTWCVPVEEASARGTESLSRDLTGMAVYAPTELFASGDPGKAVHRLAERGAALVLVCPGGTEAPDLTAAGRAADEVDLPLLVLASPVTFLDASRLVATKVLAQTTHVLEYGTRVHRTLGDVFARGAGLAALARTMSQLSGTTVLILGNTGELLAEAAPRPSAPDMSSAAVERVIELLNAGEYADGDGHAAVVELDIDRDVLQVIVAPVRVAGEPYGLLTLVEPSYPAAEHDLSQHVVIAEQGVSLTGSELLRQHSVREAEERARNDFVHALLHGRFTDQLELAARAEHYRFPIDGRFAVLVVTAKGLHPDDDAGRRKARAAEQAARSAPPGDDMPTLTALIGSMIVVVRQLPAPRATDRDPLEESHHLREVATHLHRAMRQRLRSDVRVAYGRPFDGAAGVARSYREARTTEALARRVNTEEVCSYADLRIFAAIQDSAMSPAGQAFAAEILAPLKQLDGQTGNLEELVLAYIEEAGNLNATARRLHLHRNTMLYKLDRASRAMQMDIRTTEAQFMIWLAHHITALSDVVAALDDELAPPT